MQAKQDIHRQLNKGRLGKAEQGILCRKIRLYNASQGSHLNPTNDDVGAPRNVEELDIRLKCGFHSNDETIFTFRCITYNHGRSSSERLPTRTGNNLGLFKEGFYIFRFFEFLSF